MKNVVAQLQISLWSAENSLKQPVCLPLLSVPNSQLQSKTVLRGSPRAACSPCGFDIRHFSLIKGAAGSMCSTYPRTKKETYLPDFHLQLKG